MPMLGFDFILSINVAVRALALKCFLKASLLFI
jgi:hypothetical protein